jgi:hypothetical protein
MTKNQPNDSEATQCVAPAAIITLWRRGFRGIGPFVRGRRGTITKHQHHPSHHCGLSAGRASKLGLRHLRLDVALACRHASTGSSFRPAT